MPMFLTTTVLLLCCLGFAWHDGSSREIRFAKPVNRRGHRGLKAFLFRRWRVCLPTIGDLTGIGKASLSRSRGLCLAPDSSCFNMSKRKFRPAVDRFSRLGISAIARRASGLSKATRGNINAEINLVQRSRSALLQPSMELTRTACRPRTKAVVNHTRTISNASSGGMVR